MSENQSDSPGDRKEPALAGVAAAAPAPSPDAPAPALSSDATAPTSVSTGVSIPTVIAIAAILSAFSGILSWHFATQSAAAAQQPQQIVLLNASKIVELESKATLSKPGMTADEAAAEGKAFVTSLDRVLLAYSQAGQVVINSNVVLNTPPQTDITAQVAQKLGLKLE